MHLKRQKIPKNWTVKRKGTKYVVRPNFSLNRGVPILVIFRDILGLAKNRKEVKKAIHSKDILVNNRVPRDDKNNVVLFDTITIIPSKKHYRMTLSEKGKFDLLEIKESESNKKIAKIINKQMLKGKKTQLSLSDGTNFLSELKCNVSDSVIVDLKNRKIEKCLPLKEKEKAIIFEGKHSGEQGIIEKIDKKGKIAELNIDSKKVNILIKQLMVIE
ncbi:MAG: hypothetical protein AABW81_02075 [Nanoarchaeota archaeon]